MPPVGRFAPTPSGPLHFGSLVAAVASYCQSRNLNGQWLLRIEDVDTPRVVKGAAEQIIRDLEIFGFEWDGPVSYQSHRFDQYQAVLEQLIDEELVYACQCSRKILRDQGATSGPLGLIYPGTCRDLQLPPVNHALRLNISHASKTDFDDGYYGHRDISLKNRVGDPVLRRADGIYAYHLAAVVDDENEGITQIVRGADLLYNTCIHIYLQDKLGYRRPLYYHVPLVNNENGDKLSKQTGATALDSQKKSELLLKALAHLGQPVEFNMATMSPPELLRMATENWNAPSLRAKAGDDVSANLVNE